MSTGTVLTANPRFKGTPFFASGRQDMTRKSDREKNKMKINHGVFEKALGEEGVLGTVLQSGLCDEGVDKVHAPATLWMTTKVKVRDVDFPYGSNRKQLTTAFIRRYLRRS